MLVCWGCNHVFSRKNVDRACILRPRDARRGGPYGVYQCPSCARPSKIERTPTGRMFASPDKEISTIEYLFSWIEPLNPQDFLKIVEWHRLHADRRSAFFARDGDSRYERTSVRDWLRRLLISEAETAEPSAKTRSESPGPGRPRPQNSIPDAIPEALPDPLPHPYRILGVPRDADEAEIRLAFRRLAREWHPDKIARDDAKAVEYASRRLQELVEAYETLQRDRE